MLWFIVATTVVAVAWHLGFLAERAESLAASEQDARMELAEVNHTLEDRVAAQVTEIEQLGELRRFLTPQVADAVMSADAEAITRPHRRQIAVFFCDLRGFTGFANSGAEPEEVVDALSDFYEVLGHGVQQRHDATLGAFAGDGIMAFFNDPVPCEEPAARAASMALQVATGAQAPHRGG